MKGELRSSLNNNNRLPSDEAPAVYDLIPLHRMARGQIACVASVLGRPSDVHRLHEMGLRDGTDVEMLRPGTPCIIRLAGSKLCFRGGDQTRVLVKPAECA